MTCEQALVQMLSHDSIAEYHHREAERWSPRDGERCYNECRALSETARARAFAAEVESKALLLTLLPEMESDPSFQKEMPSL